MTELLIENWIGIILICPWVIALIARLIAKWRKKKITTKNIADGMTGFLILAVYGLARQLMGAGIGYTMAIMVLLIAIIYSVIEWRRNKDFRILPTVYKLWRLLFLLFMMLYIVLLIIWLIVFII